ncbi:hypothetical protein C470_11092 [Halorubrum distributum JCM 13561]|uniref:DUF3311 domain-containing protein n=2 Tax=Halorubrum distributum TaxID=29283 RepID=M0NP65_9EURY|nr:MULTISPECIES: DUF3311 domain-containing protein [Halorubrum distributum group]EMA59418.1 hypothetical protein C470_11092 [Halorubrum litoreum JCM 13561]MYL18250.1 DUF3311 domain-containing protein [Halorubrum terrestre]
MTRSRSDLVWIPTFAILVAFAVPWPLWGVDRVVAGLPVWIWWHVAWLGLCAALFALFVRSGAWERGMGRWAADPVDGTGNGAVDRGGDRR